MARKRYKPEEIVAKLRQVDVLVSQGQTWWTGYIESFTAGPEKDFRRARIFACRNYAAGVSRPSITSKTIHGSRAMRASSTRAGPVGCRRLCSQFRSVLTGTPIASAKPCCVTAIPPVVLSRIARTSMDPVRGFHMLSDSAVAITTYEWHHA
jgi:hypothetical protein